MTQGTNHQKYFDNTDEAIHNHHKFEEHDEKEKEEDEVVGPQRETEISPTTSRK